MSNLEVVRKRVAIMTCLPWEREYTDEQKNLIKNALTIISMFSGLEWYEGQIIFNDQTFCKGSEALNAAKSYLEAISGAEKAQLNNVLNNEEYTFYKSKMSKLCG